MNQVINHVARTHPEQMHLAELQLAHQLVGPFALVPKPARPSQAIGADQRDLSHFPVADFLDEGLAGG